MPAEAFLLGASTESALLAARLDWHFVFAAHLNGDPDLLREVVSTWRKHSARDVIVAVQAIVAPTQAEAEALAASKAFDEALDEDDDWDDEDDDGVEVIYVRD